MKFRKVIGLILAVALAFVPAAVLAQSAAPGATVTQSGSTGLAAQVCLQSTGTASGAVTLTIPSPGGNNSIYIDYLSLAITSTAAVVTTGTVAAFTSTGISGTPSFAVAQNLATGGTAFANGAGGSLAIPIKGLAGVGPTFVGPTANTNFFDVMTACWHVAP